MKFIASVVVYLLIGAVIGWGILMAMKGNLWFLIVSLVVYLAAVAKLGCLPKSH
jgi:hypothetical protein